MFLSAILLKRTGTTCKKHSWHASKMADDLSFQFTYSSMRYPNVLLTSVFVVILNTNYFPRHTAFLCCYQDPFCMLVIILTLFTMSCFLRLIFPMMNINFQWPIINVYLIIRIVNHCATYTTYMVLKLFFTAHLIF